jgi:oligopeptide/dipeptide ABC transporter ATP-binding protein
MTGSANPKLELDHLGLRVETHGTHRQLLDDVSLSIGVGESLGLVGESGSGKSLMARSALRLLPEGATITGDIRINGSSIIDLGPRELRALRRTTVALVHQDPRSAMNPMRTIGDFLTEELRSQPKTQRESRAIEALHEVGIADAPRRLRQYPHQLSGGLLQRVVIAASLIPSPSLIIADEPTTALDVTTQSEVMALLREEQTQRGLSMLFITHDLDLAAAVTDRLAVMYAGTIVESGRAATVLSRPRHPYTAALMAARPSTETKQRLRTIPGVALSGGEVAGCAFAKRCHLAQDRCHLDRPSLELVEGHLVACHRSKEPGIDLTLDPGGAEP